MLVDRILHLCAADVFPAANHDVFGAVQNNKEAKIIQQAEISGVEPAVFQHFRCRLWLVPVAFHDGRPFDAYFANFVSRQSLSLFVNNSDLGQGGSWSAGAVGSGLIKFSRDDGAERICLSQSVA